MPVLVLLFFITAVLYASVGFGGGSTYNALLVLHGADYRILPSIALICNIIVGAGGAFRFSRAGHLDWRALAPWIVASVPAAWIGGRIPISETFFIAALGLTLLAAGVRLAFERTPAAPGGEFHPPPATLAIAIGAALGFISGLVGIGGGIFLAPVLYFLRWGSPQKIAAACSLFILANSLSGLAGQAMKLGDVGGVSMLAEYWMVFPAVLIGGQIGSRLGASKLSPATVKRLTAALILYVAIRLLWRWGSLVF
ncbi:MAG: sulfite exporter TauE/SafE family protein [Alphaproteobacteria bacterium]|nr:sulfite exporter TauE/SafE family protein [Alphaproteobacteria bacterium]